MDALLLLLPCLLLLAVAGGGGAVPDHPSAPPPPPEGADGREELGGILAEGDDGAPEAGGGIGGQAYDEDEYLDESDDDAARWNPYEHLEDYDLDDLNDIRFIMNKEKVGRKIKYNHKRIDWEEHVEMLVYTNQFEQRFRMESWMFDDLLEELEDALTVSVRHSMSSTSGNEPIYPHVILACGLRFLTGDTITSLADLYGMSTGSARRVMNMFLDVIDFNDTFEPLQIRLPDPTDEDELHDLAARWASVSTAFGLLNGHLAPIDGWLPRMEMPRGVPNQSDYFSGHYQCYGMNVQAMCDPDLIFMYMAVAGPGKINDIRAFSRLRALRDWIEQLPDGYFVSADNAYPLSRKILIPFSGGEAGQDFKRDYNFYLSQLRIRIEMAFGLLTTKWRRLRNALNFSVSRNSQIIRVSMKLHNYVIRKKQEQGGGRIPRFEGATVNPQDYGIDGISGGGPNQDSRFGFLESSNADDDEAPANPGASLFVTDSSRRDDILAEVESRVLRRPQYNVDRNALN